MPLVSRGPACELSVAGASLISDESEAFSTGAAGVESGMATEDSAGESSDLLPLPVLRFFLEDFEGGGGGGAPGT